MNKSLILTAKKKKNKFSIKKVKLTASNKVDEKNQRWKLYHSNE